MLSEKAKGKQRAVEPFDDENDSQNPNIRVGDVPQDILVRFTDGAPDVTVVVTKGSSVQDVKQLIRRVRPELERRHLRLIHSGRLLTNSIFHEWLTSLDQQQRRDDSNVEGGSADTLTKPATTWIHCSVGQVITSDDSEDDEHLQKAQIQPIRGFDRLASVGFSQEDIENIRRQFHSQSSANYLDHDFETDEEYTEHARAMEEQWIDSMDNAESALSQSSSSGPSILQGVLVGFFFPLIPFFFMRSPKPAVFWEDGIDLDMTTNALFSRRTAMGLVIGFLGNVLFGMWRYFLDSS